MERYLFAAVGLGLGLSGGWGGGVLKLGLGV